MSQLAVALCAVTGCSSAVAGTASPEPVIGVTQEMGSDWRLAVTPLVLVDPAPVYRSIPSEDVEEGTRLVAVQFKVTNMGREDELVGPVGSVHFHGSDGKTYSDSILETAAGPMFEQLRLAPEQSTVGYFTAELAEDVTVEAVDFEYGYVRDKETLRWQMGKPERIAPAPPARADGGVRAAPLGTEVSVTGKREGVEHSLRIAATKIIDTVEPAGTLYPGPDRRLMGVEFAVRNAGAEMFSKDEAELLIFAIHNDADEAVRAHVRGTPAEGLAAGEDATWTVVFEAPTDFVIDRISFSTAYGDDTATLWTVT